MAKYSTGTGGGGSDGDSCELCGRDSRNLRRANVAGASLLVCADCAPHDDSETTRTREGDDSRSDSGGDDENPRKRAARNTARVYDATRGDASHWEEEGTDYEDDRLPYLVKGYGERVERARQAAGLTVGELAADVEADEDDVLAVEQGRAARAGVGGSVVRRLAERLDVTLVEES
jgi:ribosome-binding protein aMBF1 (putative translation factor)